MKRRQKPAGYSVCFISGIVRHRSPIFSIRPELVEIFLKALCFYREKQGLRLFGYVVMPDHYHLLVGFPEAVRIADFLRDFKSYVGKKIIEQLKAEGSLRLLERFRVSRRPKRHRDPNYGVFQPENDVRVVYSEKFFRQKLNYIHNNPVRKGAGSRAS